MLIPPTVNCGSTIVTVVGIVGGYTLEDPGQVAFGPFLSYPLTSHYNPLQSLRRRGFQIARSLVPADAYLSDGLPHDGSGNSAHLLPLSRRATKLYLRPHRLHSPFPGQRRNQVPHFAPNHGHQNPYVLNVVFRDC